MPAFKKILLVEDNVFISELYVRALKNAGYEIETVITGPEGLEKAETGEFDLMLLDIMIPDMTGIEVLKALREKTDKVPEMKIVITTNLDQDENSRAAVEQMADGYVIKADVTPRRLIELVHQLEEAGRLTVST